MSVYQSDPNRAADDEFEPGELAHLAPGNRGRLLDGRRTPFTVVSLCECTGHVALRLEAFEDRGAVWELPFEDVRSLQFEQGAARTSEAVAGALRAIAEEHDRKLVIECDELRRASTEERLSSFCDEAAAWLERESTFFASGAPALPEPATRLGDERLCSDLEAYCESRRVLEIERAFAARFVSNPWSGELVKGHRIVLAELGLVPYAGKAARDPELFDAPWSKDARAEHVLHRLAFVRAVFTRLGRPTVPLFRGVSSRGPLRAMENHTFVSATFAEEVARSHFTADDEAFTAALYRRRVPIERLFMTYHETSAMNGVYREAEAVLLFDPDEACF